MKRGTRQGCPLCPFLLAISIEPQADLIRENPQIVSILDEGGNSPKISLFADDVMLCIAEPLTSIPAPQQCLKEFGQVSGYIVKESKSEAMMLREHWPTQVNRKES